MKNFAALLIVIATVVSSNSCARLPQYNVVIRKGRVCDSSGAPCPAGGVAIKGDTIAKVGDLAMPAGRQNATFTAK